VKDEYKVQQEILNDKMFTKFKVEIKTYNEALIVHQIEQKSKAIALKEQVDEEIPKDLRQILM